ncbi:Acyl carrier protein-like protein [Artemisia annua]|uniref:Acyl carrier protein-like protein n=1 Tax=Artemisia annua TaxID=35608 RepID=A0A2U1PZM8_ARTAN|nr:Acyl carrier protein-like protein [Artemisia annua]
MIVLRIIRPKGHALSRPQVHIILSNAFTEPMVSFLIYYLIKLVYGLQELEKDMICSYGMEIKHVECRSREIIGFKVDDTERILNNKVVDQINISKVDDDYVAVISLTLELHDKAKNSGRNGVHAISYFASESVPEFLESKGLKSVPKSVAYAYSASGYGFVEDMPYSYIHEFTRTSTREIVAGKSNLWNLIKLSFL